jgi:hypothetical protein
MLNNTVVTHGAAYLAHLDGYMEIYEYLLLRCVCYHNLSLSQAVIALLHITMTLKNCPVHRCASNKGQLLPVL